MRDHSSKEVTVCACGCGEYFISHKTSRKVQVRFIRGHYRWTGPTLAERFWAKVEKNGPILKGMDTPCWIWCANRLPAGYGHISFQRKTHKAHRIAWYLHYGAWPTMNMNHRCDNPGCVRWDHLFDGSHKEGMQDRNNKFRQAKGTKLPWAKLTEADVKKIRENGGKGASYLSREYGISRSTIESVLLGHTWKHVQ